LKEAIHVAYCHNNCFLRKSICKAIFFAKLQGVKSSLRKSFVTLNQGSEHTLNKETLLPSHPVFSLEYSALETLFDHPPKIQLRFECFVLRFVDVESELKYWRTQI
jgi:hypothetical protein